MSKADFQNQEKKARHLKDDSSGCNELVALDPQGNQANIGLAIRNLKQADGANKQANSHELNNRPVVDVDYHVSVAPSPVLHDEVSRSGYLVGASPVQSDHMGSTTKAQAAPSEPRLLSFIKTKHGKVCTIALVILVAVGVIAGKLPSWISSSSSRPSPLPLAVPSLIQSAAPTGAPHAQTCFTSRTALDAALLADYINPATDPYLTYGPIQQWCFDGITDFSQLLQGNLFFNADISAWNLSGVTNMSSMFLDAVSFNGDVSSWNVAQVIDMLQMFDGASSFNSNILSWNVAQVTDMSYMFSMAASFNSSISPWNVAQVTDMSYMFYGASSFNGNISSWNVAQVTNMNAMFLYASIFNQNLCAWGSHLGSNVSFSCMFGESGCSNQLDPDFSNDPPHLRWSCQNC